MNAVLKKLGLSDKDSRVYLALLKLGPSSVRRVATEARINRGTTYDVLRELIDKGLVTYFHTGRTKRFVAEDPSKLQDIISRRQKELTQLSAKVDESIPELRSIFLGAEEKPRVKYYEGENGLRIAMEDLLNYLGAMDEKDREYLVYSSSDIRDYVYRSFPDFTKERLARKIRVKVIAFGGGGRLCGLDQRKWLPRKDIGEKVSPSYMMVVGDKVLLVSVNAKDEPVAVVVENESIALTQKLIFKHIWQRL